MNYINDNGQVVEISKADQKWLDDAYFAEQQAHLPTDALRAVLEYRVSTKGQVDHNDIPMQKIECRRYAQAHGWRVVMEKSENGVSGSKVSAAKRDVIQDLRTEALKGTFDILLVYMFDRLGRIESETPFVLEWFVQHGIQMWSTHEGQQKIESHCDKLVNYIRFWQAAGESEKTSMRTRDRIRQIVSSGHYTGGTVPFGYRAVNKGRVNKRDVPVKDLEIEPAEAKLVRMIFEKVANEGYSSYMMAKELNQMGIKTHRGTKFQGNNIMRILRHAGYTGYIITTSAKSDFLPELKIIEEDLFLRANEVSAQRTAKYEQSKTVAKHGNNPLLLGGIVYCAHCGARMSSFMHKDRYTLKSGEVKENVIPKYNCFQRGQKLRDCDGQSLYRAEIVDGIVLNVVRELFQAIRETPCDKSIEQKLRQEGAQRRERRMAAEKKIKTAQHTLEKYEAEVVKCLDGYSSFSEEMLARLIKKAEAEIKEAKAEYAKILAEGDDEKEAIRKVKRYYDNFLGWAEEFELASTARKRMILSQLIERIEVGKGYNVTVHVKMSYQQFLRENNTAEKSEIVA